MNHETPADPLGTLADEFVEKFRQGKRPSVQEYAERFPEHADRIQQLFPMLAMMEQAGDDISAGPMEDVSEQKPPAMNRIGDFQLLQEIGRGGMGVVYEAEQVSLRRRVAVKLLSTHIAEDEPLMSRFQREAQAAARLHHPNIVPVYEVGREGKLSYYAMQLIRGQGLDSVIRELKSLGIATIPPSEKQKPARKISEGARADHRESERLARSLVSGRYSQAERSEAGASDQLAETVIQAGPEDSSPPSFSSEKFSAKEESTQELNASLTSASSVVLPGQSDTGFTESGTGQYFRSVARVGIQVADALAHAHREGIIHRDIKPPNLLLDLKGHVWVTDFGLAKTEEGDLTKTGDVMGTLQYMPPERFHGWSDPRSDLYSLGITLYEMLALRPAFDAPDRMKIMHQILEESPVPLRKLDARIPADLEAIVLKAIHREPQYRYQSGEDLKDDLERFLNGEPIIAHRVTRRKQFWLWCRRKPVIASLLAALLLVLLVGFAGVTSQWRRAEANAVTTRQNAAKAEQAALKAKDETQKATAAARRERNARLAAETAQRQIHRLLYIAQMNLLSQAWKEANISRIHELLDAYIPPAGEPDLRGFEWYYWWKKSHQYHTSFNHGAPVFGTDSTKNGKLIVSAGGGSPPIKLWDAKQGRLLRSLPEAEGRIRAVAHSPDGRWVAAGESDGDVRIWDLENNNSHLLPKSPENAVRALAFHPEGKLLAAGSQDGSLQVWNVPERSVDFTWKNHPAAVSALAWSPEGNSIAIALGEWESDRKDKQIWIRDLDGKSIQHLPEGIGPLTLDLAYSTDGRWLAAAGTNDVMLWDLSRDEFQQLRQHTDVVEAVAFSPGNRWLASAGSDRRIQVWDTKQQTHFATLKGHGNTVSSLSFSADGKCLVSGSEDGTVKFWKNFSSNSGDTALEHEEPIRGVAVSPDGKRLAAAGNGGIVNLRNLKTGKRHSTLDSQLQTITEVLFLPVGHRLAVCGSQGETIKDGQGLIEIWSLKKKQCLRRFGNSDRGFWDAAVSPDGKFLATAGWDATVKIWHSEEGRLKQTLKGHTAPVHAVAFSHDSKWLASGGTDQAIRLWDLQTGKRIGFYQGHTRTVFDLQFSPDDQTLASVSQDQTARLWNVPEGTLHAILKGHAKRVTAVSFSPNGKTLATGSGDQTIRLWDPLSGRQKGRLEGHRLRIDGLEFSPDGRTLISGDISGLVRLWKAETDFQPPKAKMNRPVK